MSVSLFGTLRLICRFRCHQLDLSIVKFPISFSPKILVAMGDYYLGPL